MADKNCVPIFEKFVDVLQELILKVDLVLSRLEEVSELLKRDDE